MATQVGKEFEESKLFDKVIFTVVSNPPNVEKIRSDIAKHLVSQPENAKNLEDAESLKMECQDTINLEVLSEEDALNLFLLHAGVSVDSSSTNMRNIASNIVKECGKLPVAIVPVAKTLKYESLKDWEAALIRLQNFDPTLHAITEDFIEAYKSLKLSYDNLKNEKVKELFLLCSLFPEDFDLPIEDFGRIAIGLGLCGNADNYYIARSQVPEIAHKLIDSSLLLMVDEDQRVKMHDLVREVAQWIGKEEIQKLEFLWVEINAKDSMELPNELFKDLIRLRVLVLIADARDKIILSLPLSFHSLRNIRSLILERWELGDISIMGSLQSLETLELTFCSITKLPNEIQALEKLRLLGLKYCKIERDNPFQVIEGIPKLEELYQIIPSLYDGKKYLFDEDASSVLRCFSPGKLIKIFSEATVKALATRAEILGLEEYHKTWWTNVIPDIVPMENEGMIRLCLIGCSEIECVIHTKNLQSGVPIFSKLVQLVLDGMDVKELCCGPLPTDFLKQLEELWLDKCIIENI
ncbi:putative disease resistance protein [Senna tora]|uniref:Putative disease resistance protein n=1 Tax=Senna tora TaxID=362788 RepID=A0A834XD84_9FABA|nr:putative disease resistance protein [Senna tora]